MKRVVFLLSFIFILLTFSSAKLFDHHHLYDHDHRIKPSSDGADSSTESTPVPDHTKSQEDIDHFERTNRVPIPLRSRFNRNLFPGLRFNPHRSRCHHHRLRFNRNPPQFAVDSSLTSNKDDDKEIVFPAEARVLRHRHVVRNFPEVESDELRMLDRFTGPHYMIPHYHHRLHRHRRHGTKGRKKEVEEKHGDHEHDNREKLLLKKIGKFLGYF